MCLYNITVTHIVFDLQEILNLHYKPQIETVNNVSTKCSHVTEKQTVVLIASRCDELSFFAVTTWDLTVDELTRHAYVTFLLPADTMAPSV